jgi:hypothetical protein
MHILVEIFILYSMESVPQPDQKFPSIDSAELSSRSIVGAEIIPETVILSTLASG